MFLPICPLVSKKGYSVHFVKIFNPRILFLFACFKYLFLNFHGIFVNFRAKSLIACHRAALRWLGWKLVAAADLGLHLDLMGSETWLSCARDISSHVFLDLAV